MPQIVDYCVWPCVVRVHFASHSPVSCQVFEKNFSASFEMPVLCLFDVSNLLLNTNHGTGITGEDVVRGNDVSIFNIIALCANEHIIPNSEGFI